MKSPLPLFACSCLILIAQSPAETALDSRPEPNQRQLDRERLAPTSQELDAVGRRANGYLLFTQETAVKVLTDTGRTISHLLQRGDCLPLITVQTVNRSQYVSNKTVHDTAVLLLGNGLIFLPLGSRSMDEPTLKGSSEAVPIRADVRGKAEARYQQTESDFRERLAAIRAADIERNLQDMQNQLNRQRSQMEQNQRDQQQRQLQLEQQQRRFLNR